MSSTMITNPTAGHPTSGRGAGTISGAAQGAAAGTAIMPGVGTVVGAVVGGIAGFLGGSEADSGARHAALAYKYARLAKSREAALARNRLLNDFRQRRAAMMLGIASEEGGTRSSAPQGAVAGLKGQFGFNVNFFDAGIYLQEQYQKHANKAGKKAANANMIMSTANSVFSAAGSMAGSGLFSGSPGTVSPISNSQVIQAGQTIPAFNPTIPIYSGPR